MRNRSESTRDQRSPPPTNANVTKSMRANKGKGTGPELTVRRILRDLGYPGYRLNWKNAPGHPDIAYPGRKIAIFVNGCFWHHCPVCNLPMPKSHSAFWQDKITRNIQRDELKTKELLAADWKVITVWECEIKKKQDWVREKLRSALLELHIGRSDLHALA